MEEGSLLERALSTKGGCGSLETTLQVHVFLLLPDLDDNRAAVRGNKQERAVLELAKLCVWLNRSLQAVHYPWWSGGDGPVFGFCTTTNNKMTPPGRSHSDLLDASLIHLRASCRYGVSVADEWFLIGWLLDVTNNNDNNINNDFLPFRDRMVIQCIDVDDGDILCIQGSHHLPPWVQQYQNLYNVDEQTICTNRCWIHNGSIYWVLPPVVDEKLAQGYPAASTAAFAAESIRGALDAWYEALVTNVTTNNRIQKASRKFHEAIAERTHIMFVPHDDEVLHGDVLVGGNLRSNFVSLDLFHTAAVVVPRGVAYVMEKRPDLIAAAITAFANAYPLPTASIPEERVNLLGEGGNDWVWTTFRFGRTHYAYLLTLCNADWKTTSTIPTCYRSPQLQRRQRQANIESTPHLKSGVSLGVRMVAGLESLLVARFSPEPLPLASSIMEERVWRSWPRLLPPHEIAWLQEAWERGPNKATVSLDDVLQCPVWIDEDHDNDCGIEWSTYGLTPWSHPEQSVASQLRTLLRKGFQRTSEEYGTIPLAQDVDVNEDWMILSLPGDDPKDNSGSSATTASTTTTSSTAVLDNLLGSVQDFVQGTSSFEGISHHDTHHHDDETYHIGSVNPTAFLHILRRTLQAQTWDDLSSLLDSMKEEEGEVGNDPYFSRDDYDSLLEKPDEDLLDLMTAMDNELQQHQQQQRKFHHDYHHRTINSNQAHGMTREETIDEDTTVGENADILSNLLQSLEASGSTAGPVRTLLQEMNRTVPFTAASATTSTSSSESSNEEGPPWSR